MEPIISPWFLYLLSVIDSLLPILFIAVVGLTVAIAILCLWPLDFCSSDKEEWREKHKKKTRWCICIISVLLILFILIPSEKAMISMYVADKLTYDTAEKIIEVGGNLKDSLKKDVMDILETINKEDKE